MTVLPVAILEGGGTKPRTSVRGGVPGGELDEDTEYDLNPVLQCGEECRAESWMKTQSMI